MSAAVNAAYVAVRGTIFVLLLLLIGTQSAGWLLRATPDISSDVRARVRRAAFWLALSLAMSVALRGALQVLSFVDPGDAVSLDLVHGLLLSGSWGHAWMTQLCVLGALTAWTGWRRQPPSTFDGGMAAGLAIVLWTQSGMGHANGAQWRGPWGRLLDSLHILGAGIWLGTLAVLMLFVLRTLRGPAQLTTLARLVHRYSNWAKAGVALIVASGVTAALVYAGSWSQFAGSTWGRLLMVKVGAMAGVLGLGWYNWRVVTPALERPDAHAGAKLHRAVRLELLLGLVMLAITAFLVATALPGES